MLYGFSRKARSRIFRSYIFALLPRSDVGQHILQQCEFRTNLLNCLINATPTGRISTYCKRYGISACPVLVWRSYCCFSEKGCACFLSENIYRARSSVARDPPCKSSRCDGSGLGSAAHILSILRIIRIGLISPPDFLCIFIYTPLQGGLGLWYPRIPYLLVWRRNYYLPERRIACPFLSGDIYLGGQRSYYNTSPRE